MDLLFNESATYHIGLTGSYDSPQLRADYAFHPAGDYITKRAGAAQLPNDVKERFVNDFLAVSRRLGRHHWPAGKELPKVDIC